MSVNIKENNELNGIAKLIPASNITLSSLPDTNITLPQAEQSLGYDEASGRWINYNVRISVYYSDDFRGLNISCTKGQTTITKTAPMDGNAVVFYVNEKGTWTVSAEIGATSYTDTVVVTSFGVTYPAQLVTSSSQTPEGATVEPTDDIQIWLACANLDKPYTTLEAVLADRETFETLIADSNACDYMARSTTWAVNTVSAVPAMTDDTHPSGVASASSVYDNSYKAWKAFNGTNSDVYDCWASANNATYPKYLDYEFEEPVCINRVEYYTRNYNESSSPKDVDLQAYDGSAWVTLGSNTSTVATQNTKVGFSVNNYQKYSKYRFNIRSKNGSSPAYVCIGELSYFEPDITTDKDTMALIGKYDYCSHALLSNATWANAIANSSYFEYVLNVKVPTMTSNTTPSGEVVYNSQYDTSVYPAWKAFDGDNTSSSMHLTAVNQSAESYYLGYTFPNKVIANKAKIYAQSYSATYYYDVAVYGGDSTGSLTKLSNTAHIIGTTISEYNLAFSNNDEYSIYAIKIESTNASSTHVSNVSAMETAGLQFYGRASEVLTPLVPTMTSNTTPSGECISSSNQSGTDAYMAFDQNDNTLWSANTLGSSWLGYIFTSKQKVSRFRLKYYADRVVPSVTVQGSDDGTTWNDIETITTSASADTEYSFDNNTSYYEYRLVFNMGSGVRATIYRVQFYQRTVQTNIVHSSANDTIYYMEEGSPVIVATTNSDGDGVLDFSSLEDQIYTFYSSVAKNPNDLTLDFCKRIRVTNSEYGGTTEMYLRPDAVSTLYWYGYKGENLEDCTSANGWSGNYTYVAPTHNINSVTLTTSSSQLCGIGTKKAINASKTKAIASHNSGGSNNSYIIANTDKTTGSTATNLQQLPSAESLNTMTAELVNKYASVRAGVGNTTYVKAFWYDRVTQHIPTFISASNDMLYIMNGATKVYIANTNGEGKSYEPLLEAGTYTIYSSVAKDPSNLSNPYSKTVTVDESTQTIAIMPSNVLYWYGYESSNLEDMSTANGWTNHSAPFSWVAPTRSTNKINIYCSASNTTCGIASKIKVPASSIKIIYQSVQAGQPSWYYISTTTKAWNSETSQFAKTIPISSVMAFGNQATEASSDCYVGLATTTGTRSTDIYAFYYE